MQLLGCRAQLQATKQSFLLLSRALTAWQQMVELRKQLEVVTGTLQVRRLTGGCCSHTVCAFCVTSTLAHLHGVSCWLLAAQAHRHRQTLRSVLQAWQEHVQRKRRKQQLLLRAKACYVFMTLLRVLQQWRARTTDKQVSRLRAAR